MSKKIKKKKVGVKHWLKKNQLSNMSKKIKKKLGVKHGLCKPCALLEKKFEKEKQNY